MRRTVSAVAAVAVLLALGGLANAEVRAPAEPALPDPATAVGREQVGTIERVAVTVDYEAAGRSATFHYPGASYVKIHVSQAVLLPGDYLTVSDPDGVEVHRYQPAGDPGGSGDDGQWMMSITGDTAQVQLHQSRSDLAWLRAGAAWMFPQAPDFGVNVDRVAHGFAAGQDRAAQPASEAAAQPVGHAVTTRSVRPESVCGVDDSEDAVCYRDSHPTVYRNSKAVVRLLINGVELCTGFRVGPDNRLLTNNHCLSSSRDAQHTEVWFNYQCASCDGWAVFRPTKVWGSELLATDQVLDFALFSVEDFDQVERYGYLELDPRMTEENERIYIPQHPQGEPARVSLNSDRNRGGACRVRHPAAHGYDRYTDVTYYCDTRGGSSGSPVLSRDTHRVVALHHFGGCPNSGVRMDLIHERIGDLV